ncbi:hypothetical protein KAR91_17155 [Candidatus Pacearchaeota archaeon]|nr:hypothetical protein [Candidatus Pacearchaeota archaeon]
MARDFVSSSSHYLDEGNNTSPVSGYPFTVVTLVNPTTVTGAVWRTAISKGHWGTNVSGFWLVPVSGYGGNVVQLSIGDGAAAQDFLSSASLSANTDQVLIVECTSSTIDFYLDSTTRDVSRAHTRSFAASTNHNLYIGAGNNGTNNANDFFNGIINYVAIYDKSLSAAERAALITHRTHPLSISPQNLLSLYDIRGEASSELDEIRGYTAGAGTVPSKATHARIQGVAQMLSAFGAAPAPPAGNGLLLLNQGY